MSKKDQLRIVDYLNHMIEAIHRIERTQLILTKRIF